MGRIINYKHLAATFAGIVMMSSSLLSALPPTIAHASVLPSQKTTQRTIKPNRKADHLMLRKGTAQPPANFKQVLEITATAYAPGSQDNDQWGNKTFTGTEIRPGVIAVDPSVIPLGSRVYLQFPDGHGEYAVAEDTGGAIKGNRIDIAKSTEDEASNFGIQNVKVYVL